MSLRDQILGVMAGQPGPVSTGEINAAIAETATPKSISMALTKLARSADIVRVAYGSYQLPTATDPAAAWVPRHPRALTSASSEAAAVTGDEPAAAAADVEEPVATAADPLVWAVWSDGDVLLHRGGVNITLTKREFRDLVRRVGQVRS